MNDYSSLDELFDIYDAEPATEVVEGFLIKTAASTAAGGIAHMARAIDANKAGPLTNDELRELKSAAQWCRAKFKKSAPSIIEDRLNKGVIKLGNNKTISKTNKDMFDFGASMSDSEMREERWAPVVTVKNELYMASGELVHNIGYDFYREIHDELEKKYPNCELISAGVGKYVYILKYRSPKVAKESVANEAARGTPDRKIRTIDNKQVAGNRGVITETAKFDKQIGKLSGQDLKDFISIGNYCLRKMKEYYAKQPKNIQDEWDSLVTIVPSVDTSYAKRHRIIPLVKFKDANNMKYPYALVDASWGSIPDTDHDKYNLNECEMGFDGYAFGLVFMCRRGQEDALESATNIGGDESMNDLFEGLFEMSEDDYADPAFESIATNLRRDYQEDPEEPISLKSMYCVHMNDDALKKYQEEYDQLKKVDKNAEKLRGCMYFWQKELAAFISIDIRSDKVWIDTLEVVKKFRGKKLSFQLLDVAVRKFHATDLKVHIDNKKAIGIFKTYGFKTYDKKNNWLYMTLRDDVKDIDDKHTEDVKPVDKGTKTDDIQEAKESVSAATESAVFNKSKDSTEVEKLLAHTEPTLRRQLTTVEDCDKYLEVIRNESTKFNEAANAIISAYSKYESGDKTKEDTKEFNKTVAAGKKLLNDNCRKLNVRLGKLVGDNDHISRQDVKNFAQYISGLRKIVNSIKRDLTKGK